MKPLSSIFITFSLFLGCFSVAWGESEIKTKTLSNYLHEHGYYLNPVHSPMNEGYMSDTQKDQFNNCLKKYKNIRKILEIGLNAGHSAENFFNNCPDLELFVSFDINHHPYTSVAAEYFYEKHGNKFIFVPGDSLKTLPSFKKRHNFLYKFDLIFVDGCHAYEWALSDIKHSRNMAHSNTVLWIDDVPPDLSGPIGKAVKECVKNKIIEIVEHHIASHP